MKFKRAGGRTVRPSLVVLDEPQTDESARLLCASILAGALLGLACPGQIMPVKPRTTLGEGPVVSDQYSDY